MYTNHADNLTDVSLPCIKILSKDRHPKSIYERPHEDPVAIGKIADFFLFSKYQNSLQEEEELRIKKMEELKQENDEKLKANFESRLAELYNIKTQKNRSRSLKRIFFSLFLLSITCILVHSYL